MHRIQSFWLGRHCSQKTVRSIRAATLRMRHIRRATVRSGQHFFKAVSEGRRDFTAIAIVGNKRGEAGDYCPPCGVCRQVMAEFCKADFEILLAKDTENWKSYTLEQLLPERFTL